MDTNRLTNILNNCDSETYVPNSNKCLVPDISFDVSKLSDSNFKRLLIYYNDICGAPVEYLMTTLLTSLSATIGKNAYFDINENIKIFLNIWSVLIGKSTIMKKSTAVNLATYELNKLNNEYYTEWKNEMIEYERHSENKTNMKPPKRNYFKFPEDSTIESLSTILEHSRRGILITNEFGGFLKRLNRSYNGDSKQFLTDIFDVPLSYEISRVTKENKLIQRPYLSIIGASTIEWFKSNSEYNDIKSGFFARFLFSIKNENEKPYRALLELDKVEKKSAYFYDAAELFKRLSNLNDEIKLKIDQDAKNAHVEYDIKSFTELLDSENPNELSFKARLMVYSLKIAGTIAITDNRDRVLIKDIHDAIQITEYFNKNISILLDVTSKNLEFADKEEKIIKIIMRNGGKMKHSDLYRTAHEDLKMINMILESLENKEKIEVIYERSKNNKSAKYYLVSV